VALVHTLTPRRWQINSRREMDADGRTTRARTPEIKIHRETETHITFGTPSAGNRPSTTNSRGSTPEKSSPKHVKGTRAKFIRQNPRFINSPICQVMPCEGGKSVAECLEWKEEETGRSPSPRPASPQSTTPNSTIRQDYRPPSPSSRPHPHQRLSPHKARASTTTPFGHDNMGRGRERISFRQMYDCRADPSQPDRGKVSGSISCETSSFHAWRGFD
jgi:hypothetical protein